jgi:hypothetical protein
LNQFATPDFWFHDRQVPADVRALADKNFALLRDDPHHPSLRLKKIGGFWSARIGLRFRVLARERADGLVSSGSGSGRTIVMNCFSSRESARGVAACPAVRNRHFVPITQGFPLQKMGCEGIMKGRSHSL